VWFVHRIAFVFQRLDHNLPLPCMLHLQAAAVGQAAVEPTLAKVQATSKHSCITPKRSTMLRFRRTARIPSQACRGTANASSESGLLLIMISADDQASILLL
jgi:hypothetical protein